MDEEKKKIRMEEKECIIREYEKQLQKEHDRANMMRFDDDDDDDEEDELVRTMEIMLARKGKLKEVENVRKPNHRIIRQEIIGSFDKKSSDHSTRNHRIIRQEIIGSFDKKSLLANPKDGVYGAGP